MMLLMLLWVGYVAVLDFGGYDVGGEMIKGMRIGEGEKGREYERIFIYWKEGKEEEFRIDNLGRDWRWSFVDWKRGVKEKGYEGGIEELWIS